MFLFLVALILVSVASVAAAAYAVLGERSRRALVGRAAVQGAPRVPYGLATPGRPAVQVLVDRLLALVPKRMAADSKTERALVQAGHDSVTAPLVYAGARVALLVTLPLLAGVAAATTTFAVFLLSIAGAVLIALLGPPAYLARAVRSRQERIRRSLPDALDLLVICIEAGVSLDTAIIRVARELAAVHPELARELAIVNRKTNAGATRDDALQGLWERTGLAEVRSLVGHLAQGEKWGTSSGKVLRVYADTLRRQRRQTAEKKAATAPVKMIFPLAMFIFPAMLVVVLVPVAISMISMLGQH